MTEAKPPEAEAAESELSVFIIPVEESKKEKTLALSQALAELVDSKENKQISGSSEGVEKKMVEIAWGINSSGKEAELGEKAEQEQDVTEDVIVLEQIQIEEKTSLYQKKVELIVEKTGGIELSENFE